MLRWVSSGLGTIVWNAVLLDENFLEFNLSFENLKFEIFLQTHSLNQAIAESKGCLSRI